MIQRAAPDSAADEIARLLVILAAAPLALGGVRLRGWYGPRREALLALLKSLLVQSGMPSRVLPHHTDAEALGDGLDLAASLHQGRPVRRSGLVSELTGGVAVVSMAERASPALVAALSAALDEQTLAVVLLDESLADEAPPAPLLLERVPLLLDARDEARWRVDEVQTQLTQYVFSDGCAPDYLQGLSQAAGQVRVESADYQALAQAAVALGVQSLRADVQALRVACLHAALRSQRQIDRDDLAFAVRQVLLPRARYLPSPVSAETDEVDSGDQINDQEEQVPDPSDETVTAPEQPEFSQAEPMPNPAESPDPCLSADQTTEPQETPAPVPDGAADRLVDAAMASLPDGLFDALVASLGARSRASSSAGAGRQIERGRGRARSIGARRGAPRSGERLHVFASLRAAAPMQRVRRASALRGSVSVSTDAAYAAEPVRLQLRTEDLHVHRERRRRGMTTVFVVDASGSTALQRLAEAKGAIELLLADCYVRRDRVALVAFRGRGAELLLPPTRSLVAARRALTALPGGGGSPVAAGFEMAARLLDQLARAGDDAQLVVLTDGRANLTRDGKPGRAQAAEQAQAMARRLVPLAVRRVLIDTSVRPEPAAQALAQAMRARYLPMPFAQARAIKASIS
jgi:magnesium chelatase subunit D